MRHFKLHLLIWFLYVFIVSVQFSAIPWVLHSRNASGNKSDSAYADTNSWTGEIGTKQWASHVGSFQVFKQIYYQTNIHSILLFTNIRNDLEVSVVYFRAGYEPGHYPTQNEWDARYLVEKSAAIKCPSIHYHLAGTKKVQQALAKPGILKRFLTDDAKIKAITNTFTGLYSMDSNTEDGQNALRMVLTDPAKWVFVIWHNI